MTSPSSRSRNSVDGPMEMQKNPARARYVKPETPPIRLWRTTSLVRL